MKTIIRSSAGNKTLKNGIWYRPKGSSEVYHVAFLVEYGNLVMLQFKLRKGQKDYYPEVPACVMCGAPNMNVEYLEV